MKFLYNVFKTSKGNKYLYDAITNKIFQITDTLYKYHDIILKVVGGDVSPELYRDHPEYNSIIKECESINPLIDKGIPGRNEITKVEYPFTNEEYLEKINSEIGMLTLGMTEQCNLRCKYCVFSGHYPHARCHNENSMSLDTAYRAVDFYHEHSKNTSEATIGFFGGEPLLEFEKIKKIIEYSKEKFNGKKQIYIITTNGTLLSSGVIEWFLQNKEVNINVTIDGPQFIHDSYRVFSNGHGSFERIIDNLKEIARKSPDAYRERFAFLCTLHGITGEIPAVKEFYDNSSLVRGHRVRVSSLTIDDDDGFVSELISRNSAGDSRPIKKDLLENYVKWLINGRKEEYGFTQELIEEPLITIHKRFISNLSDTASIQGACVPFVRKLFVNSNGTFNICEKVYSFGNFGDVNRGFNIPNILMMLESYREMHRKRCPSCWLVQLCPACFKDSFNSGGCDDSMTETHCKAYRKSFLDAMIQYCEIREIDNSLLDHINAYEIK